MSPSRSQSSWLSTAFAILTILTLSSPAHALYLYFERRQPKCFYEELPKDTLVVAHYKAEVYSNQARAYVADPNLNIGLTVEETFDNDHRVVNQRGGTSGRLTFSAADAGQHKICFIPDIQGGWFANGAAGLVKLTLDIAIGETSKIETEDKSKMDTMVQKVQDLNLRLQDIRREQVFQREREAEFRDQSEATNARVVRWALIQLVVLTATCAWQLSHLRSFFIKQKLT